MPHADDRNQPSVWRVLIPLGSAVVLSLAGDQTLYATLATQADVVGISVASVGLMLAVNRLVRIPGNPLGGVLVDRFGRRWPFIAGMFLGTLSTVACTVVHGFWPLLATRALWGISWILINISGLSMILDITVPENRGRINGLYQFAYLLGLSVTAMGGGFLVDALGFRMAVLVCACLTSAGLLVALLALPETAPGRARAAYGVAGRSTYSLSWMTLAGPMRQIRRSWRGLDSRVYVVTTLYSIARFAGHGIIMSTMSLLLFQRFGDTIELGSRVFGVPSVAGILVGFGPLMGMLVGPVAGHLSDSPRGRWRVIGAGFACGIIGFALLFLDTSLWLIVAGRLVAAVADGILAPTMVAQAGDLSPSGKQGVVMGLYSAGGDVGGTIGPILAYAVAETIDLSWVYLFCGVLYIVATLLTWRVGRQSALPDEA